MNFWVNENALERINPIGHSTHFMRDNVSDKLKICFKNSFCSLFPSFQQLIQLVQDKINVSYAFFSLKNPTGYLEQAHGRKEGCMAQFPYGPVEWPRSIQLVHRSRPDVPAIRKRAPHWGCDARVVSVRNPLNSWSMTLLSPCRKAAQPVSPRHGSLHLHPLPALPPLPTDPQERENTFRPYRVSGSTSTGHADPTVPEMTGSMRSEWVERSKEKRSEAEWRRGEWETVAVM